MNLRHFVLIASLGIHSTQINAIQETTKKELIEVQKEVETDDTKDNEIDVSTNTLSSIKGIEVDENTIIHRSTKDLKNTPLYMQGISRNLGEYLGYGQYKNILKKHNPKSVNATTIGELNDIKFPLIYDELKTWVEDEANIRLADSKFDKYRDSIENINDIIIVDKDQAGKAFLSYYKDNKLIVCTYVSLGTKGHETRKGFFRIGYKERYRKSKKYDNAPMAYALHIVDGFFLHQGYSDGKARSHGCVRVPGLYEEFLFYHAKSGTPIVIL